MKLQTLFSILFCGGIIGGLISCNHSSSLQTRKEALGKLIFKIPNSLSLQDNLAQLAIQPIKDLQTVIPALYPKVLFVVFIPSVIP